MASPVKISADEIIITFKNDKLVAQINDTNKKQLLIEAANTMFNQTSTPVTIRLPQPNDNEIIKQTSQQPKKEEPVIIEEKTETKTQNEQVKKEEKNTERTESDQEKMVLELFDGKFIE